MAPEAKPAQIVTGRYRLLSNQACSNSTKGTTSMDDYPRASSRNIHMALGNKDRVAYLKKF